MTDRTSRRQFIKGATAATLAEQVLAQTSSASATGLPTRVLGKTGQRVSIICLGGFHIGTVKEEAEAIRMMHAAIDEGMNFFDNAWDYHDGESELRMGKALAMDGRRNKVFLMTKNCERDYKGSLKCLEESLRRLRTDHLDLWQFHEIVYDNDPDWVFDKGGLKAALEAQKAGKVRFIGFTGHKHPNIHLKMLEKPFDWDTAQMPINVMDAHYRSFQNQVVPVALGKDVGVIGMKGYGGSSPEGIMSRSGLSAAEAYRYSLSQPVSAQVVGLITLDQVKQAAALARSFTPMSAAEQAALRDKVRDVAGDGRYELFKSTVVFDGPYHRKQHGFAV